MNDPTPTPRTPSASDTDAVETLIERSNSTTFGGYQLLAEVARGGMGVVYKARHTALDRIVALKLVLTGSDASESELSRFQIEAKAAARLDHPHIVPVYEIGEHDGQHFFSMGFVDGPSLSVRLSKGGPLPPREAADLLRKVAEAVDYAHRQGIIHRDLKPGNVLLTPNGEPKVTDFGLAKRLDSEHSLTATGQVLGTPAYMAPEQAHGDKAVIGSATDVYSLGATLFAALTGRPPFTATAIHELLIQVTEEPPPAPRTINPKVPAALEAICLKCLAKEPSERYASAGALAEDLKRFLDSKRVNASRRSSVAKVGVWVAAVAVVLIAVGAGMWFGRQGAVSPLPGESQKADAAAVAANDKTNAAPNKPKLATKDEQLLLSLSAAQETLLPTPTGNVWEYRYAAAAAACEQAFREFGFTLDQGDPSQLGETLKRRSAEFRESVLCGLELWELCAVAAKQTTGIEPLRQAQDSLDALDWRRSLRLARADADEKIILQIVREMLADSPTTEQIELLALLIGSRSPEKNPEALGVLRSLLQESPKNFLTNLVMASTLQAIGQSKFTERAAYASEAVVPLRAAAKARPASALPQAQLVAVFTDLGNLEAATTERERLYQRQYPDAWPLIVNARKARENKRYDQAITLLREALAKQADVPTGEFELAANLILNGQEANAEPLLQKLAQNAADDGAAFQVLQEVFRIAEPSTPGSAKSSRDIAANNPSSARVWRAFIKYRRNQGAAAPPMAIAPFDAEQAKQHQEAWAKHLGVPVEYTNSIGMKFRLIPPGEFVMGSTAQDIEEAVKPVVQFPPVPDYIRSEAPQHKVILTQPHYLGTYEVTQEQYEKVMGQNPSHFAATGPGKDLVPEDTRNFPVDRVSWSDAIEFCQRLNELDALKPATGKAEAYRLPTEAEWEFSCRAGTTTKRSTGDSTTELLTLGWIGENSLGHTHPVGEKATNPFGLFDLFGNVWEWASDRWNPTYYRQFKDAPAINPQGSDLQSGIIMARGGGWPNHPETYRSSGRMGAHVNLRNHDDGIRVALSVDAVRASLTPHPKAANDSALTPNRDAPPPAIAPFDAEQAQQHQEAWAKHLGVPVEYTNSFGMKFRLIPPGEFTMGSTIEDIEEAVKPVLQLPPWPDYIRSEAPQHKVVLTRPIYLGICEVTQEEYEKVTGKNPSHFVATGKGKDAVVGLDTKRFPVESVTWSEITEFCNRLSVLEKFEPGMEVTREDEEANIHFTGYRLPTEAEWQFAGRAGTTAKYWNGNAIEDLAKTGWFDDTSEGRTHAVGELLANPFGLFDTHGNVWERVLDRWEPPRLESIRDHHSINPCRASSGSSICVALGGSSGFGANLCRTAARGPTSPKFRAADSGFRVALPVHAVKAAIAERMADAPPPAIAPFDAEQAQQHQEAWAKHLGVPVEYTNSIGMKFRLIPPGEFTMGSTAAEIEASLKQDSIDFNSALHPTIRSEAPQHKVIITRPIYLGVNEVTQTQYEKVMGANPSHFTATGAGKEAVAGLESINFPVETVTWNDAVEFSAKLSQQEKLRPFVLDDNTANLSFDGNGYRLPTEAEWEFACRAGTTTWYWFGDQMEDLSQAGWFNTNSNGRTHAAAELKENSFGLYDIHGNVWEWVQDRWGPNDYEQFQTQAAIDPRGPETGGSFRVRRGGSWPIAATYSRGASRNAIPPTGKHQDIGFRVALTVDGVKAAIAQRTTEAPPPAIAPFDAEEAQQHQTAWAKSLGVPVEYTNSIGMKFRLIPPGEFTMGSTAAEIEQALQDSTEFNNGWHTSIKSEAPQHKVLLTQPIYFGAHEVTQTQYEKVTGRNPSHFTPTGGGKEAVEGMDTSSFPVDTVTWNDAVEFSVKLSQQEKLRPFLLDDKTANLSFDGNGYRLPTEAEWEFSCRAGTTTRFWSGDQVENLLQVGWFNTNSQNRAHAVGELKSNPFGLYDIHGNQWEWVQDRWEPNYYAQHPGQPAIDPRGPLTGGIFRVRRSGDWGFGTTYCRSSCRNVITPAPSYLDIGFRVVLTVDAVKQSFKAIGN